ncbi:MAG: hypothetical protein HY675_01100, partial [Chloroflexi bacterium]|nr:hypothetical protein [Chloroflexota bacterium]
MRVNDAGRMVVKWWQELASKYRQIQLDEYVVMPNHFHGIILITSAGLSDDSGMVGEAKTGQPRRVAP